VDIHTKICKHKRNSISNGFLRYCKSKLSPRVSHKTQMLYMNWSFIYLFKYCNWMR